MNISPICCGWVMIESNDGHFYDLVENPVDGGLTLHPINDPQTLHVRKEMARGN